MDTVNRYIKPPSNAEVKFLAEEENYTIEMLKGNLIVVYWLLYAHRQNVQCESSLDRTLELLETHIGNVIHDTLEDIDVNINGSTEVNW